MSIEVFMATPDPFARAFLIVIVLATAGIQIWIAKSIRSKGLDAGRSCRKAGICFMAVGAISFLATVQVGAISSFVAGPIAVWPHLAKICLEWFAYAGIAIVLL